MSVITPVVGMTYGFTFIDGYNAFKGVYKVAAILSYNEYLDQDGDIYTDFFEPNSKTKGDVTSALSSLREGKIYKLATVDETVETTYYFVPSGYLESSPDYNVKQYNKIGVVAYVGVIENPDNFNYLKDNVTEQIEAAFGVTPDVRFMSLGKTWMSDTEYNEELAQRDANKKKLINYFTEMKRLTNELSAANTKIAAYEKLIIQLSKS